MEDKKQTTLPEAPASNTFKARSVAGFEHLFTMRDASVNDLLDKVEYIEKVLLQRGWTPLAQQNAFQRAPKPPTEYIEGRVCPLDGGRLVKPSAEGKPIKCENNRYDFKTKTVSGCPHVEWK